MFQQNILDLPGLPDRDHDVGRGDAVFCLRLFAGTGSSGYSPSNSSVGRMPLLRFLRLHAGERFVGGKPQSIML